jgi:hypothetical protein
MSGSIDCIIILPLVLFIGCVIAFMPPVFIIRVAQFLQRITAYMPLGNEHKDRSYRRWTAALTRLRRYAKIKLTCLGEVIVLRTMLRFSGVLSEIKIGIAQDGEPSAAHAWLVVPGVVIDNAERVDFIEFSSHPFQ